jgi:hypothetical protein
MGSERPVENEPFVDVEDEEGGDPVCWAHMVCPECGAITTEGHRAGCESARETLNLTRRAPDALRGDPPMPYAGAVPRGATRPVW